MNNILVYIFLKLIGNDTSRVKKYINTKLWDPTKNIFISNIANNEIDPKITIDSNLFGFLVFGPDKIKCLEFLDKNFIEITSPDGDDLEGYPFAIAESITPDIWVEGTILITIVFALLGITKKYEKNMKLLAKLQNDDGSMPYSILGSWNGFFTMTATSSISTTAWMSILRNYKSFIDFINVDKVQYNIDKKSSVFNDVKVNFPLTEYLNKRLGGKGSCHYINIDKRTERKNRVKNELKNVGLCAQKSSATFWKDKNKTEDDLLKLLKFVKKDYNYRPTINDDGTVSGDPNITVSKGVLGCYVSQSSLLKKLGESNDQYIWITEDDITFVPNAHSQLIMLFDELFEMDPNWDVVHMGSRKYPNIFDALTIIHKWDDIFINAQCYIVRKKAIATILSTLYPMIEQVDVVISRSFKKLRMYNFDGICYQQDSMYISDVQSCVLENYQKIKGEEVMNYVASYISKRTGKILENCTSIAEQFVNSNFDPIILAGTDAVDPSPKNNLVLTEELEKLVFTMTEYLLYRRRGEWFKNRSLAIYMTELMVQQF